MLRSKAIETKRYLSPGSCIFCGVSSNLTEEHIVPRALSGTGEMIFEDASCRDCNSYANRTYEQKAWQNDFVGVRGILELKQNSRRRKGERRIPKVSFEQSSSPLPTNAFTDTLPAKNFPPLYQYLIHEPAGKLVGIERDGATSFRVGLLDLGTKNFVPTHIQTRMPMIMGLSEMVVAKMAYCYAMAERGLDAFDASDLLDLLMGRRSDVFNFVGGPVENEHLAMLRLHKFYFRKRGHLNTVIVHLFASFGGPKHEVVIGPDR